MSVLLLSLGLLVSPLAVRPASGAQALPKLIVAVDDVVDPVALPAYEVEYVVQVDNVSQEAISGVAVSAETPDGTFFGEASTTHGTIAAPVQGQKGAMVVSVGTVEPGASVRIRFELGLEAPAGSELRFAASVTGAGTDAVELSEPTFVVNRGDAFLEWDPLPPGPAGVAPKFLRVGRDLDGSLIPPRSFPVEWVLPGTEYRLYRADGPEVALTEANLVRTFPAAQQSTGAIEPGFYAVTAIFRGEETAASNVVSFGKGEPVVESVRVQKGVLKANGSDFDPGVEVTVDGIGFREEAAVKRGGTRVSQSGKLSDGRNMARYFREHPTSLVCFRNANGSVSCVRYVHLIFTPGTP